MIFRVFLASNSPFSNGERCAKIAGAYDGLERVFSLTYEIAKSLGPCVCAKTKCRRCPKTKAAFP
jgi:hypothetical protein